MLSVTDDAMGYWERQAYNLGKFLVDHPLDEKQAADALPAYAMAGMFYVTTRNNRPWGLLSVPNGLVRGIFDGMHEPGIELPMKDGKLSAHMTVFRPEELELIGGPSALANDRGHTFRYTLGRLMVVEPEGWDDMDRAWMMQCYSKELQDLRRSHGLTSLPNEGRFPFHITVAARRKGVLGRNEKSKDIAAA